MKDKKSLSLEDMMGSMKISGDMIFAKMSGDTSKWYNRLRSARDVLMGPLDTSIGPTPYDVVYEEDRVKLKHYTPVTDIKFKTPLLITYAMVNRETMLDLQPDRSVVRSFLNAGIDIYMIDWWYPTRKDRT